MPRNGKRPRCLSSPWRSSCPPGDFPTGVAIFRWTHGSHGKAPVGPFFWLTATCLPASSCGGRAFHEHPAMPLKSKRNFPEGSICADGVSPLPGHSVTIHRQLYGYCLNFHGYLSAFTRVQKSLPESLQPSRTIPSSKACPLPVTTTVLWIRQGVSACAMPQWKSKLF